MARTVLVSDSVTRASELIGRVGRDLGLEYVPVHALAGADPALCSLIDIDLHSAEQVREVRRWIARQEKGSRVIFAVNRASRFDSVQAMALGATGLIPRPIGRDLLVSMMRAKKTIADTAIEFRTAASQAQTQTVHALQSAFTSAVTNSAPNIKMLEAAGSEIVSQMESEGLQGWLNSVREHHSQTYQHCLIVTAVAVSFGQHLGFGEQNMRRLASAGLVHDIGKAMVPLEILEKPAELNEDEWVIMRMHPELGVQALRGSSDLSPEMLDMVLHHHELLDGSGYPHGLSGTEISDLVRVITISDVFGALIERRPYKQPLSSAGAYQVLQGMGPKLDADMVREFEKVATSIV